MLVDSAVDGILRSIGPGRFSNLPGMCPREGNPYQ
jgi:hypothetical protein